MSSALPLRRVPPFVCLFAQLSGGLTENVIRVCGFEKKRKKKYVVFVLHNLSIRGDTMIRNLYAAFDLAGLTPDVGG